MIVDHAPKHPQNISVRRGVPVDAHERQLVVALQRSPSRSGRPFCGGSASFLPGKPLLSVPESCLGPGRMMTAGRSLSGDLPFWASERGVRFERCSFFGAHEFRDWYSLAKVPDTARARGADTPPVSTRGR